MNQANAQNGFFSGVLPKEVDKARRDKLLADILSGGAADPSLFTDGTNLHPFSMDYPYYRVAVIPEPDQVPEANLEKQLQVLEELANDMIQDGRVYTLEHHGMILLIMGAQQGEAGPVQTMEDTLRYLIRVLKSDYHEDACVYLGCEVYSLRDLPASYRTALDLYGRTYDDNHGSQEIRVSRPTLSGQNNMIYLSELHLMLGYLINSEFQNAAQILARVFDSYVQENKSYHTLMSERLDFFVSTFTQAVEAAISDNPDAIQAYLVLRNQLDNVAYPFSKEKIHGIHRSIAILAENSVKARQENMLGPALETKSYIDDHYADPMLDQTMLSDTLGYSVSYLTRLFKAAYDQTILGYLTARRISAAETLLKETGMTTEKIAARVGYSSVSTFTRAFQKLHGVSPVQYRKNAGKK